MHESDIKTYLDDCRPLSTTARHAIALLLFEDFCRRTKLVDPLITELLDYLWRYHFGISDFLEWERNPPPLVDFAICGRASERVASFIASNGLAESDFWRLAYATVHLLIDDFYGAPCDEVSLQHLEVVIHACSAPSLPPLTPFKFSRFEDGGCGDHLTQADLLYWRQLAWS